MFIALLVCYIQDGAGSQILKWDKKVGTRSGRVLHLWHKYIELASLCFGLITQQITKMYLSRVSSLSDTVTAPGATDILILNSELSIAV